MKFVRGGDDDGGSTAIAPGYGYEPCNARHDKTYFPEDSEFYMNLNPEGEMIFDIDLLPDPKQHIIHALYVGFDESENDDEKSAIERGLRAIVKFQERVGELPIKKEMSEIEKNLSK